MSQPLHPTSQPPSEEVQELIQEIAFQKVLLSSIDDSVQNRTAAENEVKEEIRELESQLRALTRGATTTASQRLSSSQQSPSSRQVRATPSTSSLGKRQVNSLDEDESTLPVAMDSSMNREQWHSSSSMASTPNSADSLGDLVSPSQMTLPNRKRSHSKHLDGAVYPHENFKSRRKSPGLIGPSTPSSTISSGDEDLETFGNQYLVQQHKAAEERAQQLKLDEEYARNLDQAQDLQSSDFASSQLGSTGNAFDRMSGARPSSTFGSSSVAASSSQAQAASRRTLPWNTNIKVEPRSMTSGIKHEGSSNTATGFGSYATMHNHGPPVWSEPSSLGMMPGTFRDDSSASDSDIEIIPPSAFHDNGRYARPVGNSHQPGQTMKRSPGSIAAGNAALNRVAQNPANDALQMALFGPDLKQPDWMTTNIPASTSQNPFKGKNEYVYPGAHIPGPGLGYTMNNLPVYSGSAAGLSNTFGQPQADLDSLDHIISRSGHQNYDELSRHLGLDASMNNRLDYIMNDPRKTNQEIKELLEGIRPDDDLPPEDREGTPDGLVYPLYEHQKLALTWLKSMEEGPTKGGILADDMGLGKTISSLALMLSRPSTDPLCKTTLIVGPVALVRQWNREIKKKIKGSHRLSTHMMHGPGRKLSWDDIRNYDVVLTTYGTLGAEYKRLSKFLDERKGQDYDQAPMRKSFPLLGPRSVFYRVLLDEAQCIKNKASLAAKAACHLDAHYRFCLTGTPMMNNVGELYSLIRFLRIRPYSEWSRFSSDFRMLLTTGVRRGHDDPGNVMRKLQTLLKAIMLRRTKTSLIDGKPIITLPPKTEEIQHVIFNDDEKEFYTTLEQKTQVKFNRYLKAGTVTRNYSNILVLLLRLRQACCHPHLIQDFEELPVAGGTDIEGMMDLARSLAPDVVARLLAAEDAFECPVCYDGIPNPKIVVPCGHDTCSECLTKIADSAVQQNVADGQEGTTNGRCPTCRGDLVMSKVIDYSTFKKVHKPEEGAEEDITASESSDESEPESESEEEDEEEDDEDANSDGDLRNFIVPDDIDDESTEGEDGDDEAEEKPKKFKGKGKVVTKSKSKIKTKSGRQGKERKGKNKEKTTHISIAMLKQQANKSKEGRRRYMRYLKKNWQPSAKITKCVELLGQFREEGEKTIIFSQFVSLLDLLQVPINEKQWKCLRYDGSMSADERNDAIVSFTDSQEHNIMLISLKAGNAGLNLVAASRVIILDPFWNPYIEMQAVDRAYRIGQQKEVQVHRILIEATVEDRIIALQEKKRRLVESALDEGANREVGRLDIQQLAFLFGVAT